MKYPINFVNNFLIKNDLFFDNLKKNWNMWHTATVGSEKIVKFVKFFFIFEQRQYIKDF